VPKQRLRAISADARRVKQAEAAAHRRAVANDRDAKAEYLRERESDVDDLNTDLDDQLTNLRTVLVQSLDAPPMTGFEGLKVSPSVSVFDPGPLGVPIVAPDRARYEIAPLTSMQALVPGAKAKHARQVQLAEQQYLADWEKGRVAETQRLEQLEQARSAHAATTAELERQAAEHNRQVGTLQEQYNAGDPGAVVAFMTDVLESLAYPEAFPVNSRMSYSAASHQLVIELELPPLDAVPAVREHKYVKTKDLITPVAMPARERKALYEQALAQLTLRTIWAIFASDAHDVVETVVLNGHVKTIDTRTGASIYPCLVTVRTTATQFAELDLRKVDPLACLKGLNAGVSRSPSELVPVRPVLEFNMTDPRFIQEADVLSTLDSRPNLMELSPSEFESLITNLFERMGLETRLTQASRDGGVDCVAYDPRPIFGGKVVIQAKRYKNTVGVAAVRDLFGTMQNEGASKGILVATSGYGQASYDFANGKPMELLDGANLLYLLKEHADLDAKIEVPESWVDPLPDTPTTSL